MASTINANLANWSTTAASNSPLGSDTADTDADLRQIQMVVRKYIRNKGSDIASGSTVDLSTATGEYIDITGTTTITSLGTVAEGMRFILQFDGALTLTHNGTSLILPGAANITTAAGDHAMFESLGSGNWRCVFYMPKSGYQPLDAQLTTLAGITATQATDLAALSTFMGTVLNDTDAATARTTLGAAANATTQTIWVPASAMISRTTNGPSVGTVETTTNYVMIKTLDFDNATDEHAQFSIRMPKGWNEGTVTFVPVWSHASTTTNFGVAWFMQGLARGNSDAINTAFGTAQSSVDTGGTANDLFIGPESAAITIGGTPAAEDLVWFQIYRDVSDAGDTMAVDARLHGVTIYYTTTSLDDA